MTELFQIRYERPAGPGPNGWPAETGYCLTHGDGSARWTGTSAAAIDRASKLQSTSYTGTIFVPESAKYLCRQCSRVEVEEARRCYATPVCFGCLPPPEPLPINYPASMRCQMIVSPSWEGSPDIECGKPVSHAWENTPCCADCFRECEQQEARDAAARAKRDALLPSEGQR